MAKFRSVTVRATMTVMVTLAVGTGAGAVPFTDEVRYDGAMVSPVLVADSRPHARHGTVLTGNGGRVTSMPDAGGNRFLRFPGGSCLTPPCSQAVVRAAAAEALVPAGGTGRFSFGADLRLTAEPPPGAGMNVWQFGPAGAGFSQWKLQVDHGHPSCRWSDGTHAVLLPAHRYRLDVGRWYRVVCTRLSPVLFQIRVLDPMTGAAIVPPARRVASLGAIRPEGSPLIGGKRVRADHDDAQTDQFHGDLDEVYFARR